MKKRRRMVLLFLLGALMLLPLCLSVKAEELPSECTGTVDETVRQLVLAGTNPEKIALLDNFCMVRRVPQL